MIKKIRYKFILASMIALTLVITIIVGTINIIGYINIIKTADEKLELISNNNGIFPTARPSNDKKNDYNLSPEAPFETRYFSVIVRKNGDIFGVNIDKIAAIDELSAITYTKEIMKNKKDKGFINNYRFIVKENNNQKIYVFVDCNSDLNTFHNFLYGSIILSILGITTIFVLVLILSKIIVKPIEESYKKQKHFITDASHDLKTPLTVIDASADVLEMEIGENEWVCSIKEQVTKLSKLTENLLLLSKMSEENQKLVFTDFSLSEVLLEAIKPFQSVAISQNKSIITEIPSNISFCGDINLIAQLFTLLMDNALKYSDLNGQIKISLEEKNKTKRITFYNTVENIEIGNLNYLLDRFYRNDKSRNSNTGGHGIGLSIAKSIIDTHTGKININSTDGKSITFVIVF